MEWLSFVGVLLVVVSSVCGKLSVEDGSWHDVIDAVVHGGDIELGHVGTFEELELVVSLFKAWSIVDLDAQTRAAAGVKQKPKKDKKKKNDDGLLEEEGPPTALSWHIARFDEILEKASGRACGAVQTVKKPILDPRIQNVYLCEIVKSDLGGGEPVTDYLKRKVASANYDTYASGLNTYSSTSTKFLDTEVDVYRYGMYIAYLRLLHSEKRVSQQWNDLLSKLRDQGNFENIILGIVVDMGRTAHTGTVLQKSASRTSLRSGMKTQRSSSRGSVRAPSPSGITSVASVAVGGACNALTATPSVGQIVKDLVESTDNISDDKSRLVTYMLYALTRDIFARNGSRYFVAPREQKKEYKLVQQLVTSKSAVESLRLYQQRFGLLLVKAPFDQSPRVFETSKKEKSSITAYFISVLQNLKWREISKRCTVPTEKNINFKKYADFQKYESLAYFCGVHAAYAQLLADDGQDAAISCAADLEEVTKAMQKTLNAVVLTKVNQASLWSQIEARKRISVATQTTRATGGLSIKNVDTLY